MIPRLSENPTAAHFGLGVLCGALLLALVPSVAFAVLLVTLLTAAALAPLVAGAPALDWAGTLLSNLSTTLARTWPSYALSTPRERNLRLFALLAGLNTGVFATFLLRAISP